tara:strand:+ start:662 stop:919 length:258 start_codon:yes stop_codon:yes gene_type:complete
MNVNAEIEIDTSELASELVFESEFTSGVASIMQDELGNYVGDEVDRYMSDHIEDVVIDVMKSNPDLIRGLVAEAMLSIMQDNITY